ncbi:MAG: NUMOD4 motif-containing HNH endonuclease [Dysgonamonadaceae bacterium]|jgi:hypothetical protein|nr:NUMOD4 motif-containing HNH endonuclease [Dysgonamonadaceae bacterium]
MKDEIWKDIDMFNGFYSVSNYGRVRSNDYLIEINGGHYWHKGKILKQRKANCHEMTVCISCAQLGFTRKPYLVNRLVAIAFLPNPNNFPQAIHINGDNFDNRVDNLQWATATENVNKDIAQKRRSKSLSDIKKGIEPHENFCTNRDLFGRLKSIQRRQRKVAQIDNSGEIVKIFNSIKEAADYHNITPSSVGSAVRQKHKANNIIFEYFE